MDIAQMIQELTADIQRRQEALKALITAQDILSGEVSKVAQTLEEKLTTSIPATKKSKATKGRSPRRSISRQRRSPTRRFTELESRRILASALLELFSTSPGARTSLEVAEWIIHNAETGPDRYSTAVRKYWHARSNRTLPKFAERGYLIRELTVANGRQSNSYQLTAAGEVAFKQLVGTKPAQIKEELRLRAGEGIVQ